MKRFISNLLTKAVLVAVAFAAPAFAQLENVQIHGLVSQGFLKSSDNNFLANSKDGSYEFNEAAINLGVQVSDDLRVGLQFLSRDLGADGNNALTLDWAYGDYRWQDAMGFRFGKIKLPMGVYNQGRDADMLRTFVLLPQAVYSEGTRDFTLAHQGLSLYGNVSAGSLGDFDYEAYLGNLSVSNVETGFWNDAFISITDGVRGQLPPGSTTSLSGQTVDAKYITGGTVKWNTPLEGLRLSADLMVGQLDMATQVDAIMPITDLGAALDPTGQQIPAGQLVLQRSQAFDVAMGVKIRKLYTYSAEYQRGNLTLAGEYRSRVLDTTINGSTSDGKQDGYYGLASYRFTEWLELGAYYAEFFTDSHDRSGERYARNGEDPSRAWHKDAAFAARFDVPGNWILKFEAHRMNGTAMLRAGANPDGLKKDWNFFALKTSYSF